MLNVYKFPLLTISFIFIIQFDSGKSAHGKDENKILRSNRLKKQDFNFKQRTQGILREVDTTTHRDKLILDVTPQKMSPYSLQQDLENLAIKYSDYNLSTEIIGRTASFNNIILLKMSNMKPALRANNADRYLDEPKQKKIIFIVHGLSVGGMLNIRCLSQLPQFEILLGYYLDHLHLFDIFLVPMANPDGFQFAKVKPDWQKNLSSQKLCAGVNLDRNFDISWKRSDISSCSQYYPGHTAACELEVQAIRRMFVLYGSRIAAYIHVHASSVQPMSLTGEAILYPSGHVDETKEEEKYLEIREALNEMMLNASFQQLTFQMDSLFNWYGKVTGSSVDYASSIYGAPYAMEFAMQTYSTPQEILERDTDPEYDMIALNQMWKRAINIVFEHIYKNSQNANFKRNSP